MNKEPRFLLSVLMAIVMMAMSPQRMWAEKAGHVVLSTDKTTLTFYYDESSHEGEGSEVYGLTDTQEIESMVIPA